MPDTATGPTPTTTPTLRDLRAGGSFIAAARFALIVALVLAADLWLKAWSFQHVAEQPVEITELTIEDHEMFWALYPHDPVVVVPGLLNLRLTTNTGAVFGLGKGGRTLFIIVSVAAAGIIGYLFARSRRGAWVQHLALALILAGALGNLYDRARFGAVRDMLHMLPTTSLWPWLFNLADVALVVGVGLVLLITLLSDFKRRQPHPPAVESSPS